jgi:hypothetical protein
MPTSELLAQIIVSPGRCPEASRACKAGRSAAPIPTTVHGMRWWHRKNRNGLFLLPDGRRWRGAPDEGVPLQQECATAPSRPCDQRRALTPAPLPSGRDLAEHQINATYMVSISEHGNNDPDETNEDLYGRLSMWRAYGGNTNVAFVFNNKVFVEESQAIGAYTSPILYRDIDGFQSEFGELVSSIENNIAALKQIELNLMRAHLLSALHFAVYQPNTLEFSEEREWRIIHSPTIWPSNILKPVYRVVNGIPQRIYEVPLQNIQN